MKSVNTLLTISIVLIWIIVLSFRLFDKKIKRYMMSIAGCLILFLFLRILKNHFVDWKYNNYYWYFYYFSLLYIPTIYYSFCAYLARKSSVIKNWVVYSISTILFIFVLTNDFHEMVFRFNRVNRNIYTHEIGYVIIVIWIFFLFSIATFELCRIRKNTKIVTIIVAFLPIVLGLVYTIVYDLFLVGRFRTNLAVDLTIIIIVGLEILLNFNYIPNNFRYHKLYKESAISSTIVNNKGKIIYQTQNRFEIPENIINDIKNDKVKTEYNNESGENQLYRIKKYGNKYAIFKKDFTEINRLREELNEKNIRLREYNSLIEKEKEVKEKLYELRIQNEIQENLESKIEERKEKIQGLIQKNNLSIDDLKKLKLWIGYCKRISTLIIDNYNDELMSSLKLRLILEELLEDAKMFDINSALKIEFGTIPNLNAIKIYEIISCIVDCGLNFELLIIILKKDSKIVMKILFNKYLDYIPKKIEDLNIENIEVKYKKDEDDSLLEIRFGEM